MRPIKVITYNVYSRSVAELKSVIPLSVYRKTSDDANVQKLLNGEYIKFRTTGKNLLVNWGDCFYLPIHEKLKSEHDTLNCFPLYDFVNKKKFFEKYSAFTPKYFTTREQAEEYQKSFSSETTRPVLVERHKLTGTGGEGIRLVGRDDELSPAAKLYVAYVPKEREYRIHFFRKKDGSIAFRTQVKKLATVATGKEVPNQYQIRNHTNGWVYCTNGDDKIPHPCSSLAGAFTCAVPLDFGALDIIYNKLTDKAYILEVNTAPGIVGSTVEFYAEQLRAFAE